MVIFLYGKNSFLARRRLVELKQAFSAKYDPKGMNITTLDGEKLTAGKLAESLGTRSMFNPRVFLVIENLFAQKSEPTLEQVESYLQGQVVGDNVVVIVDEIEPGKTAKRKTAKPVKAKKTSDAKQQLLNFLISQPNSKEYGDLAPTELLQWVRAEVKQQQVEITPDAAQLLIALVGSNLWQLAQEVHKLASLKLGQKPTPEALAKIESADVKLMVAGVFEEKIFALTDAISQREKARALKLFEDEVKGGNPPEQIFSMIVRQFRNLLAIRQAVEQGMNAAQIASELRLHPFVAQKGMTQARNFSLETLKNIMNRLVQIEYNWKTGQGDVATGIVMLIAKL